jgi:hypothetical protein
MHYWGKWPDELFSQVGEAADFIGKYCRKYGRISVTQTKEKYGTARVYCGFGIGSFHDITHPGYAYGRYPKFIWRLNIDFSYSKIGRFLFRLLNKVVVPYQQFIYRRAYELAFKKWPLIREEIISGADWPEVVSQYWESIPLCDKHSERSTGSVLMGEECLMCPIERKDEAKG